MLDLYEFETAEAAPVEAAPAEAAVSPEDATGESAPPSDATPAASVWDDPRFAEAVESRTLELLDTRLGPISQLLQQSLVGEQAQAPQALTPPDPFSENYPAEFAAYQQARDEQMMARFEQMIGRVAQPLEAQAEAAVTAEGNQRIDDMIADDITRNGDLVPAAKAQVRPLAEALFPQIAAKGYQGPRAAEMAVAQATNILRGIAREAGEEAVTRKQNELATLAGARSEPGVGTAGVRTAAPAASTSDIVRKYAGQAESIRSNGHI